MCHHDACMHAVVTSTEMVVPERMLTSKFRSSGGAAESSLEVDSRDCGLTRRTFSTSSDGAVIVEDSVHLMN